MALKLRADGSLKSIFVDFFDKQIDRLKEFIDCFIGDVGNENTDLFRLGMAPSTSRLSKFLITDSMDMPTEEEGKRYIEVIFSMFNEIMRHSMMKVFLEKEDLLHNQVLEMLVDDLFGTEEAKNEIEASEKQQDVDYDTKTAIKMLVEPLTGLRKEYIEKKMSVFFKEMQPRITETSFEQGKLDITVELNVAHFKLPASKRIVDVIQDTGRPLAEVRRLARLKQGQDEFLTIYKKAFDAKTEAEGYGESMKLHLLLRRLENGMYGADDDSITDLAEHLSEAWERAIL